MTRFEKYSTFAQKYCKSKYNHPVIYVKDLVAKVNGKDKTMTTASCSLCSFTWVTTHPRLKKLLETHELRE